MSSSTGGDENTGATRPRFRLTIAQMLWLAALCGLASGYVTRAMRLSESQGPHELAFSSDGRLLAAMLNRGGVYVWDVSGPRPERMGPPIELDEEVAVSDFQMQRLQFVGSDRVAWIPWEPSRPRWRFVVWDIGERRVATSIDLPMPLPTKAALTADGQFLATNDRPGAVQLLDADTGRRVAVLRTSGGPESFEFSADGKRLVIADGDYVKIYEANSGTLISSHLWPKQRDDSAKSPFMYYANLAPTGCYFSIHDYYPDDSTGASRLLIMDAHGEVKLRLDDKLVYGRSQIWFLGDSDLVALSVDEGLQIWNIATAKFEREIELPGGWFPCLASTLDGNTIAVAERNRISLWDVRTGRHLGDAWRRYAGLEALLFSLGFAGWAVVWGLMRRRTPSKLGGQPVLKPPGALRVCWNLMVFGGLFAFTMPSIFLFEIGEVWYGQFYYGVAIGVLAISRGVSRQTRRLPATGLLQMLTVLNFDPMNPIFGLAIIILSRTRRAREYLAATE